MCTLVASLASWQVIKPGMEMGNETKQNIMTGAVVDGSEHVRLFPMRDRIYSYFIPF